MALPIRYLCGVALRIPRQAVVFAMPAGVPWFPGLQQSGRRFCDVGTPLYLIRESVCAAHTLPRTLNDYFPFRNTCGEAGLFLRTAPGECPELFRFPNSKTLIYHQ